MRRRRYLPPERGISPLSALEIGDAIPPELYEVVAQILVFVDGMDKVKSKLDAAGFDMH